MLSTVLSKAGIVAVCLASPSVTLAAEDAPRTLRVPVVGLRYEVASATFDRAPMNMMQLCATLADDKNMRSVLWTYASVEQERRTYYVIGGYGIRAHPEPPTYPRYEPLDLGIVLQIDGRQCKIFGEAREVFETRNTEEVPVSVLQQLANNLVSRLEHALGGQDKLRAALYRQRLHPTRISPELNAAFKSYEHQ